jgi:hypothetical protein
MSLVQEVARFDSKDLECVLSASASYVETLSIKVVEAQPWLVELAIKTQVLTAKNPGEKRVKSRTYIDRTRLVELHGFIGQFLQEPGSLGEPPRKIDSAAVPGTCGLGM